MRGIRKNRLIMFSIIFIIVISLTIGFSAFQKQLLIDDSIFNVRLQKDTRVSGIVLSGNGGSAESSYEEYNVSKIYGSVDFPSTSSYVLYKVSLTNYGNVKTGLLNITSNTSGVSYEICNSSGGSCTSNPKTAVCSGSNCTLGASKDIYVKVKSSSAGTKTIDLDFDFEPYNDITYSNIRENTSTFTQEIMTHDSLSLTLTSKPEEVDVSGTASYTYNKNTGVLNINNVGSDLSISAKYLSSDVAEDHYTGSNPDNYVMLGDELYRIVTKENVNDGFGNTDLRVKLIKETSIGNNQFDGLSNEFNGSSISTVLNETYYESMETETKNLIETVAWTENATSYIGLINSTDYTSNSSWMPQEGYTLTKAEDNKIVAITTTGLTDSNTTTSRATYPVVYLKESVLITSGEGTKTNPFILELAGNGLRTNPTVITGNTLTVNGSNQSLVTVTNQVGSPRYSLDNPLNASNYTSGDTTIPTGSVAKDYIVYFYIPEHNDGTNGYKAKAGSVSARINPLSFIVNYTKGANVASIGKNGDSCTTSGASTSCNVTLPSITPNPGNENGKWNYSGNQYNPGSSFTLNSSKNNITLTATASGSTYTATFNKNGATSIGSTSLTCTVTEGSTCTVTAPSIAREGYSTHGWGESASAHSGVTGAITLSGNKTFYAVTSKDVTITFNKNGNTGQIKNGGTQSNEITITDSCTIWNTATSCNITSPEIVMAGYEKLGYSTGATTYSNYWNQKTAKAVSADATWYAQTAIAEKTVTITFNRNGNTSQTPKNGSASTATTVTESCTIAAARNGASQATTCSITSPTINMSGFTIIGYSDDSDNHTSSWNQNTAKDVSTNATYYAQSSKASIDRTITFYKNGNTAFTYNSTRYTDTSKTFTACTIPAVYNGATQNTSCTATITMPTIEVPTGFTPIGWSGAAGTHTATYTSGQSNVSITMNSNKSFYAQSGKDAINRTVTFYRNGNTAFTYNSTRYTDTSKTFTACTIPAAYNGDTQGTSCTATINMPTIEAPEIFTNIGWSDAGDNHEADYTSGQTNVTLTMSANKSFYAQSSRAGVNRTATFYRNGNTAFTYNSTRYTDTSKTFTVCTTPTVYNGASQSTTCNATITMPTIEAPSGFTALGWSGASGTHTAANSPGESVTLTMNANKSFYAQSKKNSVDRTITFYRNGNTSFTYNGTTYTDTSKTFTVCTIPEAYNGDTQSNSCTATINMPTISVPSGFTRIGWSGAADTHTATYTSGQSNVSLTMTANMSLYAQSKKDALNRTITFYKNGNTSFTYNGTTYTDTSKTFTICTIPAVYNGATQNTSCTATITMPTITAPSGFNPIGWSDAADNHEVNYTSGQTNVSLTMSANMSLYAQSNKAAVNRTITFYKNGNTSFTYSGTTYTDTSKTFTVCTIPAVYNGATQNTSCTATINMPTIAAASGFTVIGWSGAAGTHTADYTSGQSNVSLTMNANKSFYAQSSKASVNRTITFYKNGNTNFKYNGTTYTDTSKTFTVCTIDATYNGATQNTSCTATINMPTITAPSGFTALGWSDASDNHEVNYTSGQTNVSLTMSANMSLYAQSKKDAVNRTITFYKNGNTNFKYNGTTYTDTSKTFTICTIPAVYNGATQGTSCTATITMPTITAPTGFTVIGWSGASGTHTATYTSGQTNVSLTMTANMSLYAQSGKDAVDRTITFYKNGNTNFKYNGTTYTDDSKTFTVCTIPAVYNGDTQASSCTATITMPTITAPTGYNQNGWGTASDSTSPTYNAGQSATISMNSNKSYYALKTLIAVNTPTISGAGTYIYSQPVTLTCSTTSTYSTGTTLYYSFGYASSDGGTPSNWSTANTSSTYTFTISSTTARYYSCKIYATDGTQTTETVTSSAAADAEVIAVNARVDFDATTNGGTLSGTTPRYVRYNNATIYANRSGANTGTVPTATKTGWTFDGWYTQATGGSKVINSSGTVQPNISGWTNSNGRFILTNPSNTENTNRLYAQFTGDSVTATFYYNSNTTSGQLTTLTATSPCTVISGNSCTVEVPAVVQNSVGKYNSTYNGVTTALNSMGTTSLAISSNTTFYANYSSPITIYYPNSSNTVSNSNTALYRNEYFTDLSGTEMNTITSNSNNNVTPAASVTLTGLKGTFQGLETSANTYSNKYAINDESNLIKTNRTTYYAVVTASENAVIHYNSSSTCGTFTDATANAPVTSTYYCSSTSAMGTSHGSTTTVPNAVSSSKGQYNDDYAGVSSVLGHITNATSFTGGSTYYAYYSSPITIYYPNTSNGISSSTNYLYRNEYYLNSTYIRSLLATNNNSETQVDIDDINFSNIKGTLQGFAVSTNSTTYKGPANTDIIEPSDCKKTFYAVTTGSENVSFVYNSNTTSGSLTATTDTSTSVTSTYYCSSTSTMGTSHGTTTTVPASVSSSVGKYNSPYLRITALNSMTAVTSFSGGSKYYAAYSKNNSSKGVTIYYPTSTTARSNTTYYRNEFFTSDTAMTSVLNTTQTATSNFTFNSSVSGYGLYGFANTYSNNSRDYETVADLANSDKTTSYAILRKSVSGTFYYNNSGNTCGTTTITSTNGSAYKYVRCTSSAAEISNTTIDVPTAVSSSKGPYNGTYLGVGSLNSMTAITPSTATEGGSYYAIYRTDVTNYYYGSSYTNRSLYRNEFFTSASAMNAVLATTDASDQTANYTTSGGPNGSTWYGLADTNTTTRKYSTVALAAKSNTCTTNLYTIYNYNINYSKGSNVSAIGATIGSCQLKHGDTSCSVTLPTITPNTNYMSVGWNTTSGATTGTAAGGSYIVSTNSPVQTLYANAVLANYTNTSTNESYSTLNDAFSAVANNQTIKVLQNTTETTQATLADTKTGIKLDLNGKTITMSNTYIKNNGTLDIYNTSSTTGTITGGNAGVISNNGSLTLNGTSSTNKIIIDKTTNNLFGAITNSSSNSLTINNNVEVKVSVGSSNVITNEGNVIINGGTITGDRGIENTGTTTISGGTITGTSKGINNASTGQLFISGSSTQITSSNYGINNSGTITMTGGTITSSSYGINNIVLSSGINYYGNATITGGTIQSSSDYAIYVNNGTTLTLGIKDASVSTSSPLIQTTSSSNKCGVYVNSGSTFNFYDGIIKSSSGTGYAISGTISDTPDGYSVYKETASGVESAYLVGSYLNTSTGSSYTTLNNAFSAVANNQTIKVMQNTAETTIASLASSKTGVKLDLNGKTITMSNKYINNNGTLDIYNTSSTTGTINGGSSYVLDNNGTLTLNGTSSTNSIKIVSTNSSSNIRVIGNSGLLTMNDNVEIIANNGTVNGINTSGTSTTNINGGSISVTGVGISNGGTLNVSGSTQITSTSSSGITNDGTATISGGTITASKFGISNGGTLNVSGSNTTITGTNVGISNEGAATISGGTISGAFGIHNGEITINSTTYGGSLTVTGGTIIGTNYGIYTSTAATLTLGTKDSTVDTSSPSIQNTSSSNKYGVYVTSGGTFNFYDGIIKSSSGAGYAIRGTVSDTPTGYTVYKETVSGVESAYLTQPNYTNTTTGTGYNTLSEALDGVASNQTIKVMANTTENTAATLASTKTGVTLDLNGKTITSSASPVITNSGTLTITNATTGNGVLQGSGTNTLTNSGTLYIKGDSISETTAIYNTKAAGSGNVLMNNSGKTAYLQSNATLKTTEYQDDDYRYVVKNYGILNIDGASIMGNKDSFDNGVQNYSTLNMSFGLIDAETEEGVGIEGVDSNAYTQNVTITGGLIKGNEYAIAYDGNNNSNSTVTIGVNDGTTSITTPELRANNYYAIAVGSNKTFNFYDGIIKSSHGTGYAINRTPDNIPTGYIVYKETVSGVESAYLTTDYNYMNSSTHTGYTTLSAAFSAVESNQTIQVLNNVNETTAATLASGKTGVKLELKGKTITTTQTITNNGSLQISMSGTITTSSAVDLIVNNGTITIGGPTITNTQTTGNYTAIKNYGTATISSGTVHSEKYVGAMNYGTLNINGGTITSNASNSVWSNNTLNISGGNISVGNNTDAFTIGIAAGNATISGGTITGGLRGVLTTVNGSNSTVNITGSANLVNTSTILSAIDNYTTLNISGGTITSQNFDGIQNKVAASVITMTGGTITAGKAGIYLPAGTLTLGTNDSTVSTSSPLVESVADADSHGITNTGGTFNFYDGIVKSSSGMGYSIYGNVDNTPTGYIVTKTISSGVESAYLVDSSNTANTLMGSSIGAAASNYLRTTIARQDIETLTFTNSISGHTANGTNCWDVSVDEDGTVLAWVTDTDSDGKYEMTIGSSGGIVYASNCGFQFYYLNNLTAINGMEYFDTSRATSMTMMFGVCSSLESIDLSHLDTSNVTNMTGMFAGCSSLETLNISDFDTSHVTVMNQMFNGCSSLTTIYASGGFILPTPLQTTTQNMFNGCTSLIGGNGTEYDSNYVNGYYAVIDSPSEPGYFTDVSAMPTTTYTATFVYNSNTTAGSFTKATTTATCSTSGTSCTVSVPSTVSSSVGKYNSPYKGVYAGTGNMGSSSLTISADTTYYANYSGQVTENYYNGSSYQNRTLYRNEYFSSASAMAARLATSNTATTNMTHEVGPNNATFGGYSRTNGSTTTSYSSVSSAATTSVTTLYSVYKSQVTFNSSGHSGVSKNSSNSNTISCSFTNPNISCSITTPNYYPFSNYQENGWIINGTNENVAIGSTYTVSGIKTAVSNEIAISNPTTYTFRFVTPDISSPYPHGYRSRAVLSWWDYDSGDTYTQDNLATTKDMIADITLKSAVFNSPKEILVNIVSAINNHNINYISVTPKFTKDGTSNPTGGGDEIRAIYPPGVTWSYNGWKYNDTLLIDDDGLLIPNVSGYTDSKGHLLSTATFTETNGYVVLTPDYVYTVSSSGGGGLISSIGDDIVNSVGSISKSVGVSVKPMMKNDDVSEISSTSKFLGTDLLRGEIRSIKFDKTLGKHKVDDKNTWDVSNTQDGSILLWVDKVTDGYYDITIGQEGGVIAPSNAKYLFAYLNNLESIDLTNFDTSNTLDTTDMYYGCSSLNKQNIKEGV